MVGDRAPRPRRPLLPARPPWPDCWSASECFDPQRPQHGSSRAIIPGVVGKAQAAIGLDCVQPAILQRVSPQSCWPVRSRVLPAEDRAGYRRPLDISGALRAIGDRNRISGSRTRHRSDTRCASGPMAAGRPTRRQKCDMLVARRLFPKHQDLYDPAIPSIGKRARATITASLFASMSSARSAMASERLR